MKRPSALIPVIAGFSVMLILMAAVTAIGVTYVRILSQQLTAIVSERNEKAELATTMRALHEARYQSLMLSSALEDPFARDEEIMRFSQLAWDFIQAREKFLALPLDEAEFSLWSQVRKEVRGLEGTTVTIVDLLQADRLDEAHHLIKVTLLPAQESMMGKWGKLVAMQREKNRAALDEAKIASTKAQRLAFALSAGALIVGLIIALFVIRLSRRMEMDLFEEKEQAQVTLQAIGDAVVRFDAERHISYLNPVAEKLLGIRDSSAMNEAMDKAMHLFDKQSRDDMTDRLLADTLNGALTTLPPSVCLLSKTGVVYEVEGSCAPIHTPEGEIIGGVLIIRDVTDAREMHRRLLWQADHDGLTGLLNRRAFEEKIAQTLSSRRGAEFPMSVLYIDLDHFKPVNDTAGHAAGDELLRQTAHLMQARIRDTDTLARMGGDEFAVALNACPDDMAEQIAQQITDSIGSFDFQWEGKTYRLGASIGVVHVPPHWSTLDECMAAADAACYKAKENGRAGIVVHRQ